MVLQTREKGKFNWIRNMQSEFMDVRDSRDIIFLVSSLILY